MTSRYKSELVRFMSYKDGVEYSKEHEFTVEELLQIKPEHLCRWMNQQAYGDPAPREDMRPVNRRSSTLEFCKKAISSFMPHINSQWVPVTERGNPTRSDAVNKLIKTVKKFEVRREGVESKARRSVEFEEFMNLLVLVRTRWGGDDTAYMVGSVLALQWHICARIDDMMKLQFSNFSANTQYPSTLLFQMRWSKDILEERDSPEQIVFGSMDPKMCVLLNLAVYIESTANVVSSEFVYGNPKDGDRAVRRFLANMVEDQAFKKLKTGKLGTHSLHKGAATYATRSGISKDSVNRRGRWRTRKGVVDVYIDNLSRCYDCRITSRTSNPCFYTLKAGIGCVAPALLVDQIAPTVKQLMGEAIAKILALPLLWAALEPHDKYEYALLPNKLKQKVLRAYTNAGGSAELNPVQRESFYVTGDGSQLNLVTISSDAANEHVDDVSTDRPQLGSTTGADGTRRELAAIHSQIHATRQYLTEVMNEVLRSRVEHLRQQQKTQAILRRLVIQKPAFRRGVADDASLQSPSSTSTPRRVLVARLSKRPKDLYELWHEYQIGCGELKAAKEFTSIERGANKFAYSRRKCFWNVVSNLVRSGFTSDTAIDKVYAVYGKQQPVSKILVDLRADRKRGGHPILRV